MSLYAQIKGGIVQNVIVLDNPALEPKYLIEFDFLINIDSVTPKPSKGWLYDSGSGAFSLIDTQSKTDMIILDKHGLEHLQYLQVRFLIWDLLVAEIGADFSGWAALSDEKKFIAAKWGLAPYALRLTVIEEEQDIDYFTILLQENSGIKKETLVGRLRIIEEMRQFIGLNYFRNELLPKKDVDDFYSSVKDELDEYAKTNSINFRYWLNNTAGTAYESDGFKEKGYYSDVIRDSLNKFLDGIY